MSICSVQSILVFLKNRSRQDGDLLLDRTMALHLLGSKVSGHLQMFYRPLFILFLSINQVFPESKFTMLYHFFELIELPDSSLLCVL